jgi:hypothetical protein
VLISTVDLVVTRAKRPKETDRAEASDSGGAEEASDAQLIETQDQL